MGEVETSWIDELYTDRFVLRDVTTEIDFGDVVLTRDLITFLHSLTDEALLHDPRWSDPWGREP